jgi:FCP1-like phosphatase family protein
MAVRRPKPRRQGGGGGGSSVTPGGPFAEEVQALELLLVVAPAGNANGNGNGQQQQQRLVPLEVTWLRRRGERVRKDQELATVRCRLVSSGEAVGAAKAAPEVIVTRKLLATRTGTLEEVLTPTLPPVAPPADADATAEPASSQLLLGKVVYCTHPCLRDDRMCAVCGEVAPDLGQAHHGEGGTTRVFVKGGHHVSVSKVGFVVDVEAVRHACMRALCRLASLFCFFVPRPGADRMNRCARTLPPHTQSHTQTQPPNRPMNYPPQQQTEAASLYRSMAQQLQGARKLHLVLDIDLTLLHATIDPRAEQLAVPEGLEVHAFDVMSFGRPLRHWCCLRPGLRRFLDEAKALYVLTIYTHGRRDYAHQVAKVLDPDKALFGDRIVSRDDCPDLHGQKSLQRLFPGGIEMALIMDDSPQVWQVRARVRACVWAGVVNRGLCDARTKSSGAAAYQPNPFHHPSCLLSQ